MLGDAQTGALMSTAQIAAIQKAIDRAAALPVSYTHLTLPTILRV